MGTGRRSVQFFQLDFAHFTSETGDFHLICKQIATKFVDLMGTGVPGNKEADVNGTCENFDRQKKIGHETPAKTLP